MRWFWIDRYTEFESGRRATAIKNVSLAEDHLHDHFPGAPMMPNPLVIEGMAQTAGLLVGEHGQFEERVILAKLVKARFHFSPAPGDTLTYRMNIESLQPDGATSAAPATWANDCKPRPKCCLYTCRKAGPGNHCLIRPGSWPCCGCWEFST